MSDDDADDRKPPGGTTGRWPLRLDRVHPREHRLVEPGRASAIEPTRAPDTPSIAFPVHRTGSTVPSAARAQILRPQRLLSEAAREAAMQARRTQGQGLDSQPVRLHMVQRLRETGCTDEAVLAAMAAVPRHVFVDGALVAQAYEDTSLPIGLGQTISKPSVVARMIELLRARPGGMRLGSVLEIGTGCGYQAALLALLARRVVSIERIRELHERAQANLAGCLDDTVLARLQLVLGDGRDGHPTSAPFDGIIAAAGGAALPPAWLEQLARGGRLVAPVFDAAQRSQVLMVVDRLADGSLMQRVHEPVRFVPLESGISESGHP